MQKLAQLFPFPPEKTDMDKATRKEAKAADVASIAGSI